MRFQVNLAKVPAPRRFGRLRKALALWLWPELREPQVVDGVMEYAPAQNVD